MGENLANSEGRCCDGTFCRRRKAGESGGGHGAVVVVLFAIVVALIVAVGAVRDWLGGSKQHLGQPTSVAAAASSGATVSAQILRHECFTPCGISIDFSFQLDTQGDPIVLKFPGIAEPVRYSGKGTIEVPDSRDTGIVHITSPNPAKAARVQIWERTQVTRVY